MQDISVVSRGAPTLHRPEGSPVAYLMFPTFSKLSPSVMCPRLLAQRRGVCGVLATTRGCVHCQPHCGRRAIYSIHSSRCIARGRCSCVRGFHARLAFQLRHQVNLDVLKEERALRHAKRERLRAEFEKVLLAARTISFAADRRRFLFEGGRQPSLATTP